MLGTYQEDPANSGEFPAFVKENKHLYFLKVSFTLFYFINVKVFSFVFSNINLQTFLFARTHFTTLKAGPYQTT